MSLIYLTAPFSDPDPARVEANFEAYRGRSRLPWYRPVKIGSVFENMVVVASTAAFLVIWAPNESVTCTCEGKTP